MANRVATERTAIGLFHRSFNFIRTVSSFAPPPSSATACAADAAANAMDPEKPKRRKKKNLFEVAQFLPNWGLGYKMAKSHWRDVSYEITKVNLYKDGRHGKAWGIRNKAGLAVAGAPVKISGVHKRGWKYIPEPMKKAIDTKKAEEPQSPAQVSVA
ncbi:uncharacterized protein M6B38_120550 [Iris pallida]|nr:uncharacterized protein M6B38_120550 [Iris pallida]